MIPLSTFSRRVPLALLAPVVVACAGQGVSTAPAPAGAPADAVAMAPAPAGMLRIAGRRDHESTFRLTGYREMQPLQAGVMDFKHYHTTEEINYWMERWARERPEIVERYQVATSFGGAPIWQITLTNKKTGKDTDKPAAFFEGGRHSGEITSSESVLWLAWHLIENYGKDPAITKLLDEKAIYLKPNVNPDGADMYKLTAQSNRSSVRPVDNDGDGKLDEDPGEDLDGDGHVRQMRRHVGAGKGNAMPDPNDPSGRLMRNVPMGQGEWLMYSEGVDNDRDGRINEDGIGGLDLHRNYPYNWRPMTEATGRGNTQFGAGEYPLSEPETRAVFMFQVTHPNISVTNSMDTSVPMHLRGPSTCEETECVFPADLALMHHYDSVGLSKTNYPWAGDVYRTYATRFAPPGQGQPEALFGHGPDFGYFQMGQIWYGDELWNGGRERDYNGDGRWDQYEVLRYCDEEFQGTCYQKWTKTQHPEFGEVEVGGYDPKFFSQNGPPSVLERWAKNQALFNLAMAMDLPRIEIADVAVAAAPASADSATHTITVTVRNSGRIPTALEQAKRVHIVNPDAITTAAPRGSTARVLGRAPEFFLAGYESKTFTTRVRVPAGEAVTFTVRALSTRGGEAMREVRVTP